MAVKSAAARIAPLCAAASGFGGDEAASGASFGRAASLEVEVDSTGATGAACSAASGVACPSAAGMALGDAAPDALCRPGSTPNGRPVTGLMRSLRVGDDLVDEPASPFFSSGGAGSG
jgi:hypothetical protein